MRNAIICRIGFYLAFLGLILCSVQNRAFASEGAGSKFRSLCKRGLQQTISVARRPLGWVFGKDPREIPLKTLLELGNPKDIKKKMLSAAKHIHGRDPVAQALILMLLKDSDLASDYFNKFSIESFSDKYRHGLGRSQWIIKDAKTDQATTYTYHIRPVESDSATNISLAITENAVSIPIFSDINSEILNVNGVSLLAKSAFLSTEPSIADYLQFIVGDINRRALTEKAGSGSALRRFMYEYRRLRRIVTFGGATFLTIFLVTWQTRLTDAFLDPVNAKVLGPVRNAGFSVFTPMIDGIDHVLEKAKKKEESLAAVKSMAEEFKLLREKISSVSEMEKMGELNKLVSRQSSQLWVRWEKIFYQIYTDINGVSISGHSFDYNFQTWNDLISIHLPELEFELAQMQLNVMRITRELERTESVDQKSMLNQERILVDQNIEIIKDRAAALLARLNYIYHSYYPSAASHQPHAMNFNKALGMEKWEKDLGMGRILRATETLFEEKAVIVQNAKK